MEFTAKPDPTNPNCFIVFIDDKRFCNVGASNEASAIALGKEIYIEHGYELLNFSSEKGER